MDGVEYGVARGGCMQRRGRAPRGGRVGKGGRNGGQKVGGGVGGIVAGGWGGRGVRLFVEVLSIVGVLELYSCVLKRGLE